MNPSDCSRAVSLLLYCIEPRTYYPTNHLHNPTQKFPALARREFDLAKARPFFAVFVTYCCGVYAMCNICSRSHTSSLKLDVVVVCTSGCATLPSHHRGCAFAKAWRSTPSYPVGRTLCFSTLSSFPPLVLCVLAGG